MYGVQIAFQNYKVGQVFGESQWVGFAHFRRFFHSVWFTTLLKNTLVLSLLQLAVGFPLPIILAILLNEVRNKRGRYLVQTVSYAPHFISVVVLCGVIHVFLSPNVGIIGTAVNTVRS